MKATVQFIENAFARFNGLCFGGELPPIPIRLTPARSFLGKVCFVGRRDIWGNLVGNDNFVLRISTAFDLSENELEDVVIHEMIHYYIALKCIHDTSTHGEVFRRIMTAINLRHGRNVTLRHQCREGELSPCASGCRPNLLCVMQLSDGNWGIISCARTKLFYIHRQLSECGLVFSMNWYGSTNPFFNRYPRCRTAKIYKITREELDKHLADATLLKCDGHSIKPV